VRLIGHGRTGKIDEKPADAALELPGHRGKLTMGLLPVVSAGAQAGTRVKASQLVNGRHDQHIYLRHTTGAW